METKHQVIIGIILILIGIGLYFLGNYYASKEVILECKPAAGVIVEQIEWYGKNFSVMPVENMSMTCVKG
jgi:hypothetical protein